MASSVLSVDSFSLNGDYGSYLDGQSVICTVDKSEHVVIFSFMAQISKSDFGIFYGVEPIFDLGSGSSENMSHSGASVRPPIYILPAVYVIPKPKQKPASSEGSGSQGGASSEGGGQGSEENHG